MMSSVQSNIRPTVLYSNIPPSSKFLKRESSKGPPKLKTSLTLLSAPGHQYTIECTQKRQQNAGAQKAESSAGAPHRSCSAFMRVPYSVHVQQSVWTMC